MKGVCASDWTSLTADLGEIATAGAAVAGIFFGERGFLGYFLGDFWEISWDLKVGRGLGAAFLVNFCIEGFIFW